MIPSIVMFALCLAFVSLVLEHTAFELFSKKDRQKQLMQQKRMFVDFLCHEIKMPLQLTATALDILLSSRIQEKQVNNMLRRMIETIQQVVGDSVNSFC